MKNMLSTLPARLFPVAIAFGCNAVLLLIGAILIENGVLSIESAEVVVIMAVVLSAFAGSMITVIKRGTKMDGYIFALLYLVILFLMCLAQNSGEIMGAAQIKEVIAVFCGTIIGNLFGSRIYYKLRNSGRNQFKATKYRVST